MREATGSHLRIEELHGKWVPGCEGRYSVTDDGKVFSFVYPKVRRLGCWLSDRGYPRVNLRLEKMTSMRVHILVALTYLGPRPEGLDVHHKDGDKLNNNVCNLEYVTKSHNIKESFRLGRVNGRRIITESQAREISSLLEKSELTVIQIANRFGVSKGAIYGIKDKRNWKWIHNDYDSGD